MMENFGNKNNYENIDDEDDKDAYKEKYDDLDKKLYINNGGEEDINFD